MHFVGFEPTSAGSNGFQVQRLPRRASVFSAAGLLCPRQVPAMRMVAVLGAPWCHKLYNVSYCVFGSDFPPCTDPPLLVACPVCVTTADLSTYSSRTGACSLARRRSQPRPQPACVLAGVLQWCQIFLGAMRNFMACRGQPWTKMQTV